MEATEPTWEQRRETERAWSAGEVEVRFSPEEYRRIFEIRDWIYSSPEQFRGAGVWLEAECLDNYVRQVGDLPTLMPKRDDIEYCEHLTDLLGVLIDEAVTWKLAEFPPPERGLRSKAILTIHWLITDFDADEQHFGVFILENEPLEPDEAGNNSCRGAIRRQILGPRWFWPESRRVETPLRKLWMDLVEAAWNEVEYERAADLRERSIASGGFPPSLDGERKSPPESRTVSIAASPMTPLTPQGIENCFQRPWIYFDHVRRDCAALNQRGWGNVIAPDRFLADLRKSIEPAWQCLHALSVGFQARPHTQAEPHECTRTRLVLQALDQWIRTCLSTRPSFNGRGGHETPLTVPQRVEQQLVDCNH